jgi:hypothetical protein
MAAETIRDQDAAEAVAFIIKDLKDRGGLGEAWGRIDDDTKREIVDAWIRIVRESHE